MSANASEGTRHEDDSHIGVLLLRTVANTRAANLGRQSDSYPYLQAPLLRWQERDANSNSKLIVASSLSSRERSILEGIGQGKSNKEIAKDLSIAPETVKSHVKNIFVKLAVKKRAQAVARAHGLGLVDALYSHS